MKKKETEEGEISIHGEKKLYEMGLGNFFA